MTGDKLAAARKRTAKARISETIARKIFRKLDEPVSLWLLRFAWLADRALHLFDRARNRWGDGEEMTGEERTILANSDAS